MSALLFTVLDFLTNRSTLVARRWRQLHQQGEAVGLARLARRVAPLADALESKAHALDWDCRPAGRAVLELAVLVLLRERIAHPLGSHDAAEWGLATFTPDDLDWNDEIRLAVESRLALSPDVLTGLEANLRFGDHESMDSRIFGRLSAWQNWIFIRPNAVGPQGALKVYGAGTRPKFDWQRV